LEKHVLRFLLFAEFDTLREKEGHMFQDAPVISGFSTNNTEETKRFYGDVLGFEFENNMGGIIKLNFKNGGSAFIYPKENHEPATFTVLNILVKDIEQAVNALREKGVIFERYNSDTFSTDEKGIAWGKKTNMGPNIAWFKDPAGNILSLLEG
jgi:predicted enzyme related to lactoylglutathione lyase